MKNDKCVFPGSFNPFTVGHRRLVELALQKYNSVIVAVAELTYKADTLPTEIRLKIASESLADVPYVDVKYFGGMLTDFLAEQDCFNIVRGIRNGEDAAYEKELERLYVSMDSRVKFDAIRSDVADVSADKVRVRLALGQDVSDLVCGAAAADIIKYYGN